MSVAHITPLPFARRPYRNEILRSWLSRLACVYGTSWESLYADVDQWNLPRIADYGGTDRQFQFLGALTRLPPTTIKRLDLSHRFRGQPLRRFLYRSPRRRSGSQFLRGLLARRSGERAGQLLPHRDGPLPGSTTVRFTGTSSPVLHALHERFCSTDSRVEGRDPHSLPPL